VTSPSSARSIDVRVFPAFRAAVKATWLRKVAKAALAVGDPDGGAAVSLVVADDETLHGLNARFRGLDELTDVLSFGDTSDASLAPEGSVDSPFPDIPDDEPSLGEVVLSYPLAERQADAHNVSVQQEVALLVVHGILHLLGHDHAEPGEEASMKSMEAQTLAAIFPPIKGEGGTS
jgi:probable rRNA maturation factor